MRLSGSLVATSIVVCVLCSTGSASKIRAASSVLAKPTSKAQAKTIDAQPAPPTFSVMSVQQLRSSRLAAATVSVREAGEEFPTMPRIQMQMVVPGAGNPAYATGDGVVLDFINPHHAGTGSDLGVHSVVWNDWMKQRIVAGDTRVGIRQLVPGGRRLAAVGYFDQLPSASHTYVLTVGTSVAPERVQIRVGSQILSPEQLVASPETSEMRALLSYAAGEHQGQLVVSVYYVMAPRSQALAWFHHIQLAQLD